MTKSFSDFSAQLMALKERLEKKEDIANVAGDGAVDMAPNAGPAKKPIKRKKETFNVSPQLFDRFRRGKTKFERWSKYLDLADENHKALYQWAIRNPKGICILQNSVTGEIRAIRHNRMGGGQWHKISRFVKEQTEATDLPKKVKDDAEKNVKDLKKNKADFVKRYGDKWKDVMYGTAMTQAKKKYGMGEKKFGATITKIKDSIIKIGVKKEDINTRAEKTLYETPAEANDTNILILKSIIETKQVKKVEFYKGGTMRVDVATAEALMGLYEELSKPLQEKFQKMLNLNQMGLKTLSNFAYETAMYGEPQGNVRPIASIGNMKSPRSRPAYALNAKKKKLKATAKGPALGTLRPINLISKKKK